MNAFVSSLLHYAVDIAPSLALGFLISGVIHEFVPQDLVNRHFTRKGIRSILYVTIAGVLLPLCCFGSLPVAVGLRRKGVPLGPVLAFMVATPATSVTAILMSWQLMGGRFTMFLCVAVIVIGVVMGFIGNLLPGGEGGHVIDGCPMCAEGDHTGHGHHEKGVSRRVRSVLTYGFIDIPRDIGLELAIGILLAAAVGSSEAVGDIIRNHLAAGAGYAFAVVVGPLMYMCATASVPLVHAFVAAGLGVGAGLALLLVGPITSYGTMLVVRTQFGGRVLAVYLLVICGLSAAAGYLYELTLGAG